MGMMNPIKAIKGYFERADKIAPDGGKKVSLDEIKELKKATTPREWVDFAGLCAAELGAEIDTSLVKGL